MLIKFWIYIIIYIFATQTKINIKKIRYYYEEVETNFKPDISKSNCPGILSGDQ